VDSFTQAILVGVTGVGENTDALRYAAAEARATGAGVTLVHAVHTTVPPSPPGILITDDTWVEVGASIVAEVRHELEEMLGGEPMTVTTVVHRGPPGALLAELSQHASKIVLQHRALSRLHRLVSGSTVASVVTHAHCPVVSVPAGQGSRPTTSVVAAGVHVDGGPRQVVEVALAEAAARRSPLRLVYAWRMPEGYDDLIADAALWSAQAQAHITDVTADLCEKHPEVEVSVDVCHEWPADALARTAAAADLLVLGRHSTVRGLPPRLGSLARVTIAHATCPVVVVPL
jgi:nucleotide-binding universal stress UspA family protein